MLDQKIKKYAYFLEVFCKFVIFPVATCSFVYGWLFIGSSYDELFAGLGYSWNDMNSLTSIPTISKILGMIVDGFSYLLLFIGIFYFIKFLKFFQHGKAFSPKTLQLLQYICKIALAWTVYMPVKRALLTVVTLVPDKKSS